MSDDPERPGSATAAADCGDVEAMLDAYALDALDPAETAEVVAHLARCADCRARLTRSERTAAALAFEVAPVAPPARLRRRLLAEIAELGPAVTGPPPAMPVARAADDSLADRRARRVAVALSAVAAALVIGLIGLGLVARQAQLARDDARADQREFAEYLAGGGVVTPLVPAPGAVSGGQGSLIVAPNQPRAMLLVTGFAIGDGQHYRVWVERGGDRTWVGELTPARDGTGYLMLTAPEPLTAYDTVGIALETPQHPAQDLLTAPIHAPS
jgi:anti-sigma factor RsiW